MLLPPPECKSLLVLTESPSPFAGNFEEIADRIIGRFKKENIECQWQLLEPAEGTKVIKNN